MLRKFTSIKNVGRFRNSAASGNPQLAKQTLVLGANGFGKTTICAVLRSLQTGDASHVLGRRTLGVSDAPVIELLLDTGPARFDGTIWNATKPALAIFDGMFVADNIHSGEVVDIEHKRNLCRVIIGDDGVKLAAEDAELAATSRAKTGEITTVARAIQSHMPTGMKLDAFLALPVIEDIDNLITEQEQHLDAVRQADAIRARQALSQFVIPALPEGFADLLGRTIDDIAKDAQQLLADHLTAHDMTAGGENWIATGIEHTGDTCPFCGQDIRSLPLITAFRAVFSARYKAFASEITATNTEVARMFGDAALARYDTVVEQNNGSLGFWSKYCALNTTALTLPADLVPVARRLGAAALSLLDRKTTTPLEPVPLDADFAAALEAYDTTTTAAQAVNEAIRMANTTIAEKKATTGAADVKTAEAELARRRVVKTRHSDAVAGLCTPYVALVAEKDQIDRRKETARARLDAHTKTVVKPYERRINAYLDTFNAGFSITETKHAYPGGVATSSYQLVINDIAIDVGDNKTPADQPSFKNTLSRRSHDTRPSLLPGSSGT